MEFSFVSRYSDKDVEILSGALTEGERIVLGKSIAIELMDDSLADREIMRIRVFSERDHRFRDVDEFEGPGNFEIEVVGIDGQVKTPNNVAVRKHLEEQKRMVCLTPFDELGLGEESIYDWVVPGYTVPDKVVDYLMTTECYEVCLGVYEHPFKPGKKLLGPYTYTDGHYWWDRDAWKYVVKYHVGLPQEFVDYVMSGEGDEFLESHMPDSGSWHNRIDKAYGDEPHLNLLPTDGGDIGLEDF